MFCGIHLRAISRQVAKLCNEFESYIFEITEHLPGAKELMSDKLSCSEPQWFPCDKKQNQYQDATVLRKKKINL